jgi:UDP-N-acetylglucosamine acyltransferase
MIDARAVISPQAEIAVGVEVGPFSIIGPNVSIGAGTWIGPHVVINGPTRIGADNKIFQFASLGDAPQDKKYKGEPTRLEIGDRNVIREFVTIHAGTSQDKGVTTIGDGNWLLAYSHVAHDCVIGNETTFSNNAQLAGHVIIDDYAVLGGFVGVHQFCRVGAHAMLAAGSIVLQDVPPYVTVAGSPATPRGTNSEGLRRRGFGGDEIAAIRRAYKTLYRQGLALEDARAEIAAAAVAVPALRALAAFLETPGRGIIR